MPHLSESTEYKRRVVNLILNDAECVELITGVKNTTLPAASLVNNNVFLYDYIDETTTDAKVYVCIEVDDGDVRGPAVTGVHLWIYVSVPKSMMNMNGEIRRDALTHRIDELLNGNKDFGFGKLERRPGGRIVLHDSFRGRFLHYYVLDWNRFCSTLAGTTSVQ
jgi:hypothetical protein